MAVADAPGLMDIASTLIQDEIPFKLRCAICNKLAVNAFRLPCCDQSICETCQTSLSDTCPVCTHTPVSPDLCKPNKALRTTLKAFLRTEEKKREKDRQSAAPPTPSLPTPVEAKAPVEDAIPGQNETGTVSAAQTEAPVPTETIESKPEEPVLDTHAPDTVEEIVSVPDAPVLGDPSAESETAAKSVNGTDQTLESATEDAVAVDSALPGESVSLVQENPEESGPNLMAPNMAGNTPPIGWNGNGVNPFMPGMFNYPNTMGMPMGMGPMANQGMFGGYGMNMTGMGMNSGMNYNGGMYGSLGWDASQQNNNMWQGGQNKFNPNAFANGTGPPYGGAFGGSNMSAYPSHSDYQSGYYGGYGRGGFRGRGRGQFHGSGRGGFGPMQGHYRQGANSGYPNQNPDAMADDSNANQFDAQGNAQTSENVPGSGEAALDSSGKPDDISTETTDQPQGIPTIESLDNSVPNGPAYGHMNSGYGQYRYGRYGQERGPGVEGAPAAPRAMREGLPNTSVLRQRGFQVQGRASVSGEPTEDEINTRVTSRAPSQRAKSRSQSPSQNPASRVRSPSVRGTEEDRDSRRGTEVKRMDRVDELQSRARYSRSPSRTSSRRSSRRRHHDSDRERDRRTNHRSQRSRRHRSRSRSLSRNRASRASDRVERTTDRNASNGRTKASSEAPDSRDLESRISSYRSKDRSRREDEKSRGQDRDTRRRDRDHDRPRDRRGRDRDPDRDDRRDNDRDKDRGPERDRDRPRDHGRDRKRSRRDRSPSAHGSERPQSRRVKHGDEDHSRGTNGTSTKTETEKDPYTLEREARNKERLEREKQHRDKAKSGRRRDSRQDRVVAGRRINYKYEDEL